MTTRHDSKNPHYAVPTRGDSSKVILFEAQPIVAIADGSIVGHELLYRGPRPAHWPAIDAAMVQYLRTSRDLPLLFVNLSNHGLMEIPFCDLVAAAANNPIVFELSESVSEYSMHKTIAAKVNALIDSGVHVAVDDFGTGRDSLERIYELNSTHAVKVDRLFLQTCASRDDAGATLRYFVQRWREAGIWSIVEGVEDAAMYQFARSVGVDMVQGWHIDALVNTAVAA
jgi:EAL domain-containing protein (putative c-di-GMP-specific phosphodiesterase class I)